PAVVTVFNGLRAVVVAIVANAAFTFGRSALTGWRHAALAGVAALLFGFQISPILVIAAACALGLALLSGSASSGPPHALGAPSARGGATVFYLLAGFAVAFLVLFFLNRPLFQLASLMSRIDLLAFGGGFASVPLLYHETVEVRHWLDSQTLLDGIALGQVTPGPIVITATFVGYALHGAMGAVVSTIAVFTPSFLLVVGVTPYFDRLRSSPRFSRAIRGILCSFVGLLLTVAIRFGLAVHWSWVHVVLAVAALGLLLLKVDILWVVLGGVAVCVLLAAL
ncbi:MAG: chromate efflux transporter, partial [Candidatus Sumerlaeota bacterium]|nr:chromate efflux transporter [Candidatus Sumerlaeota bacterium]